MNNAQAVATTLLAQECQRERTRFQQDGRPESPACVELFRRALATISDQEAWIAIQQIFEPLMRSWIGAQQYIEPDDVIQDALFAFSCAELIITDQLSPILAYLRRCTKTALLQIARKKRLPTAEFDALSTGADQVNFARQIDLRLSLEKRLNELLHDEKEALVFQWRFVHNVGPQQIYSENRATFQNQQEVATIIQRLTRRMRKDTELRNLWSPRQIVGADALLKIVPLDAQTSRQQRKGSNNMDNEHERDEAIQPSEMCPYNEAELLDYVTGLASATLQADIEQSLACLQEAHSLSADMEPLLAILNRWECPDPERLVAFQESRLAATERLVIQKHVESCFDCQQEQTLLSAIDEVPLTAPPGLIRRLINAISPSPLALLQPLRGPIRHYRTPELTINLTARRGSDHERLWVLTGQLRNPNGTIYTAAQRVQLRQLETRTQAQGEEQRQEGDDQDEHNTAWALTTVDEMGKFQFSALAPSTYELQITTIEEVTVLSDVVIGDASQ